MLLTAPRLFASGAFPIDENTLVIGANETYTIKNKETLIELAREYDVGYDEIVAANSDIDPWVPDKGAKIVIPGTWLLPETRDDGIVINLAELRLYYFFSIDENKYVKTFPLGIGRQGFNTPTGDYKITGKVKDPVWRVPESIRAEDPERPEFVPPGPENPLGGYWLHLSIKGYGIHGTNRPYGIGRRVSHGCIRLYPEDIEILFSIAKPGTPVKIIDEPVKTGAQNNMVYIEVHSSEREEPELMVTAVKELSRKRLLQDTDTALLIESVKSATGLPAVISK